MANKNQQNQSRDSQGFDQKVLQIRRVSKKTKGGDRISFTALVVLGDHQGRVGVGLGKAPGVKSAIEKGSRLATRELVNLPLKEGTIPHPITAQFSAAKVLLKPAPQGSGVIAGGSVRAVLEVAGVKNIVAKMLGNNNKLTNVFATMKALRKIEELEKKHTYRKKIAGLEDKDKKAKKTPKKAKKAAEKVAKKTEKKTSATPDNFANLSTRTQNALQDAKLTPTKIVDLSDDQLLDIKGIGQKSLEEIRNYFPAQ